MLPEDEKFIKFNQLDDYSREENGRLIKDYYGASIIKYNGEKWLGIGVRSKYSLTGEVIDGYILKFRLIDNINIIQQIVDIGIYLGEKTLEKESYGIE